VQLHPVEVTSIARSTANPMNANVALVIAPDGVWEM
jgi:hypothetical protein